MIFDLGSRTNHLGSSQYRHNGISLGVTELWISCESKVGSSKEGDNNDSLLELYDTLRLELIRAKNTLAKHGNMQRYLHLVDSNRYILTRLWPGPLLGHLWPGETSYDMRSKFEPWKSIISGDNSLPWCTSCSHHIRPPPRKWKRQWNIMKSKQCPSF